MGMAFTSISQDNVVTVFDNMYSQNKALLKNKIFSVWLNRNYSESNGGEIFFGGSDSNYYTGTFTYLNLSNQGYWQFKMDGYLLFIIVIQ